MKTWMFPKNVTFHYACSSSYISRIVGISEAFVKFISVRTVVAEFITFWEQVPAGAKFLSCYFT